MNRTPMRARVVPLPRTAGLGPGAGPERWTRMKPVSAARARENRTRAKMADRRWPDRREGTVLCAVWEAIQPDWCDRFASDLHEIVRRSQGGSITDEENTIPACRTCNGLLADGPDWGYRIGVINHDALCCRGRDACERYTEGGAA
ncbi:MAG TPA: hypothetical protein VHZ03_14140 [Trebonia sp.]|nr:hypothetical protein [Trebonia sp.]